MSIFPQGLCDTTGTPRFKIDCKCNTYKENLGSCLNFLAGINLERCVYCEHKIECHNKLIEQLDKEKLNEKL